MSPGCLWGFWIGAGLLVALVLLPYVGIVLLFSDMHLVDPPRPAIVQSLVDAAPAGSRVTVRHWDDDRWGSNTAHWGWTVSGVPGDVTLDAYRAWCEDQGLTPMPEGNPGMRCGDVSFLDDVDDEGNRAISGTIDDDSPLVR